MAFHPPDVEIGDTVFWFDSGNKTGKNFAALVVNVGQEAVDLLVLLPQTIGGRPLGGVRHVKDPLRLVNPTQLAESGAWDHRPEWYDAQQLVKDFGEFRKYTHQKFGDQAKATK